jgi:KDO2-lipid IV(A) lauroyltransferase
MDRAGVRVIPYKPRWACARESLRVLKENGIVQLLLDQNPRKKYGAYVAFFGFEVPTYTGPIIMAQRSGAALVPLFMHRQDDGRQVLTILPEVSLVEAKGRKETIADNVRTVNRLYEEWISAYPSQWWWIHRRFRRARNSPFEGKRRGG